jgi:hypothetical protein
MGFAGYTHSPSFGLGSELTKHTLKYHRDDSRPV